MCCKDKREKINYNKGCPRSVGCWEETLSFLTSLQTLTIGYFSKELEYFPWPSTVNAASASASARSSTSSSATTTAEEVDDTKYHPNPKHYPFISLVSLALCRWERLKYLPDQLQHLTTLRHLSIDFLHGLETLPEWLVFVPPSKGKMHKGKRPRMAQDCPYSIHPDLADFYSG